MYDTIGARRDSGGAVEQAHEPDRRRMAQWGSACRFCVVLCGRPEQSGGAYRTTSRGHPLPRHTNGGRWVRVDEQGTLVLALQDGRADARGGRVDPGGHSVGPEGCARLPRPGCSRSSGSHSAPRSHSRGVQSHHGLHRDERRGSDAPQSRRLWPSLRCVRPPAAHSQSLVLRVVRQARGRDGLGSGPEPAQMRSERR